jgi:hypothetical protein
MTSRIELTTASPDYLDRRASFVSGSEVFTRVNFFIKCNKSHRDHYEQTGVVADWRALCDVINTAQCHPCPCVKTVSLSFTINRCGI